jgi:hypothetical protein
VGIVVDDRRHHVDAIDRPAAVHRSAWGLGTTDGLSSTGVTVSGTSVHGGFAPSSPASTDAKTTDENLSSLKDNDKNDQPVDRVESENS